jgi:hypothetical protein
MACKHGKRSPRDCKICDPTRYAAKIAWQKAHYAANRDKRKAYNKAYYEANRNELSTQHKAYYEANRDKQSAWQKAYRRRPENAIAIYKKSAQKRGHCWDLTDAQAAWLVQQPCAYCKAEAAGGIDRAKNEYGYTVLNSVPCCGNCNFQKRVLTVKAFIVAVNQIARYCPDYPKFKRRWERIRKKLTQLGEQQDADVSVSLYRVPRNHGTPDDICRVAASPVVLLRGSVGSNAGMSSVVS